MMKIRYLGLISLALISVGTNALADDNIAACEVVLKQQILPEDERTSDPASDEVQDAPMIATFVPAEDFVFSVFDGEPGHLKAIDGKPIQAVMCRRNYIIPTEFDLRMIETGIPLYLSQNFDSADSDLMAVFLNEGQYQYQYSGADLSPDNLEILETRMATLNAKLEDMQVEKEKKE
jgi:hypothetical protein